MAYLITSDFYGTYTKSAFDKLITNENGAIDANIWLDKLPDAIEEISSYLRARYDVDLIFGDLLPYADATAFVVDNWIVWSEPTYSATATYLTGARVSFNNGTNTSIYVANQDVTPAEAFDPLKWDFKALNESKYKCILASTGNIPTTAANFEAKDPRNGKIKEITVDVVLYNVLNRLNNIDIAANRKERYDGNDPRQIGGAIGYLKMINKGTIQPDLPIIQANQDDQTGNIVIEDSATESKERNFVF